METLRKLLDSLSDHYDELNLGVAVVVALTTLFLLSTQSTRGDYFEPRAIRIAAWWWLIPWVAYCFGYALLSIKAPACLILIVFDVGTLGHIGFAAFYMMGDDLTPHRRKQLLIFLAVALGICVIAAFLGFLVDFENLDGTNDVIPYLTIAPSALLANIAMIMAAWAFLLRYGTGSMTASALFVASVAYSLAQLPAYVSLFALQAPMREVFVFLALMKAMIAMLCLAMLATPFWTEQDRVDGRIVIHSVDLWPKADRVGLNPGVAKMFKWLATAIAVPLLLKVIQWAAALYAMRPGSE